MSGVPSPSPPIPHLHRLIRNWDKYRSFLMTHLFMVNIFVTICMDDAQCVLKAVRAKWGMTPSAS